MYLRGFLFAIIFLLLALCTHAQVTIGSGTPPAEGALLQLKQNDDQGTNSTKGLLLPRVGLTDLDNLFPMFTSNGSGDYNEGVKADQDAVHAGLVVFNVNTKGCAIRPGIYAWDGLAWVSLSQNRDDDDISGYSFDRSRDSLALVSLYNNTGGTAWTDKTNWLSNKPITEWAGVTCIEKCANGKTEVAVTGIHFENNNLTGTLPSDLKDLVNLTDLSLPVGQLNGNIPTWISDLTKLQVLDLRSNLFTGAIPDELGDLTDLEVLDIQDNQLSGTIPATLGNLTNLSYLNLAYNNSLTGAIPSELGDLTSMFFFDLQYCSLTGSIPTTFSGLTSLFSINLSGNQLSGNIPANLLSVMINEFCPQYLSGGSMVNINPWTNYTCP